MDLKIKDVAELLHISETTVHRLLEEGKIPAYRLNQQYHFSRAEIEAWLMQQQNSTRESQEEISSRPGSQSQFSLYRAVYRGDVLTHLPGTTKAEIFRNTMEKMAVNFDLDAGVLTDLFLDREELMPTSLGHGIGVPHTRDFLLNTHYDVIQVVYPKEPIEYGALDGEPVHTLFFLFACEDRRHLNLLAKVAHLNMDPQTRAYFKTKPSKEQLLEFLKSREASLS